MLPNASTAGFPWPTPEAELSNALANAERLFLVLPVKNLISPLLRPIARPNNAGAMLPPKVKVLAICHGSKACFMPLTFA